MREEREAKPEARPGRHHAHAEKIGNGRRKARRNKRRSIVLLVEADADFEAWFRTVRRQLGLA